MMQEHALVVVTEQAIRDNRAASRSNAYRRMLAVHWGQWEQWCATSEHCPLPANPLQVEQYLLTLADLQGKSVGTVVNRLSAIDYAHRLAKHDAPGEAENVKLAIAGIRRRHGRAPSQAAPLTVAMLAGLPDTTLHDKLVRAVLLLGACGLFRRSELCGMDVEHVRPTDYGVQIFLPKSKTDQESHGAWVDVVSAQKDASVCPVEALMAWLRATRIVAGPLFRPVIGGKAIRKRLGINTISGLVKQTAAQIGLDPARYSSHSLRSGGATFLAQRGAPVAVLARHGRWSTVDMVLRYYRGRSGEDLQGYY